MKNSIKKRWGLTVSLVLFVFFVMMTAMILAGILVVVLHRIGILSFWNTTRPEHGNEGPFGIIFVMMAFSILLGTTIAAFFSKKALNPIRKVIAATYKISEGDFSVRTDLKGVHELEELSRSFNRMAHELSSIETLRSDFINNFSHEFKTPIVSIRGFAKLLKEGHLSADEKQEYLDIIITESERLAQLSTNVLTLSKYENIKIITDQVPFRLDEQIRRAVVMFEPKWSVKNITIDIELDVITFFGNEDLTQQIWLNLLDNAIKFSGPDSSICIRLTAWNGAVLFTIQDTGEGMSEQTKARIFDKFYQGDTSHAKDGNGLGMTIVKRIVALYDGRIELTSAPGKGTVFSIHLPNTAL